MFRKSMGSGDNGKPHKRSRTWERAFARKLHGLTHDVPRPSRLPPNREEEEKERLDASYSSSVLSDRKETTITDRGYFQEVTFPVL